MTAFDIIVIALMGGNALLGLKRGLVQEMLSLGALIVAVIALRVGHEPATEALSGVMDNEGGAAVAAFIAVFAIPYAIGRFAAHSIGKRSRRSIIGPTDRVLGVGFGALKGLIFATIGFLGYSLVYDTIYGTDAPPPEWTRESASYPLVHASAEAVSDVFADEEVRGLIE